MDPQILAETLHPLERAVLPHITKSVLFEDLVNASKLKDVEVMRAVQWMENKGIVTISADVSEHLVLGANGKTYAKSGLPEKRFLKALGKKPLSLPDAMKKSGLDKNEFSACLGVLKKRLAIEMDKGMISLTDHGTKFREVESAEEQLLSAIAKNDITTDTLSDEQRFAFTELSKRQDIVHVEKHTTRTISITDLGKSVAKVKVDPHAVDRLTPSMLSSGEIDQKFRRYDVTSPVPKIAGGRKHFVNDVVHYARRIWLDLGFKEMEGNMVQTNFWNLDALFVPQDHSARSMQDTFYIAEPSKGILPKDMWKKVKDVHEHGGDTGSRGWGGNWSKDAAAENVLRTHTTVLSAQTLAGLKKEDLPAKFFAVGKVFRNETLDWKHLFEFYQTEGIVVDPNANLKHLKGYLIDFFKKMGYPDVRIRPAHFPYTEPSCEVDVLHPEHKQWIELGGCGIFRPEISSSLLGFECPVLAWGLGLGRIMLPYYGITDLRDLYKNDLKQLREMKAWVKH